MEMIYFTIVAVVLYVVSDKIVSLIERKRGEHLPNRSMWFFVIILTFAVISFNAIQYFKQTGESKENSTATPTPAGAKEAK
ncbi:hypothetical protein ACFL17_01110 [Pseudomonadota bacterium]